jgi:two-component system chemotaxis response regulator CheB
MTDKPIRVLVADDSKLARELIIAILSTDKDMMIVGEAQDGREAVRKTLELKPDVVTMDIEMPVMNGLEAIERIMADNAVPILVVTTHSDSHTAFAAISKGALDLVQKPDVNLKSAKEFIDKIKLLSKISVISHILGKRLKKEIKDIPKILTSMDIGSVVAIASSTGGPEALSVIMSSLPEKFPSPIVVAQHISDGFVPGIVGWLDRVSKLQVKVAAEGDSLSPATVYISPSEMHMEISASKTISFVERRETDMYRPSCDILLSSAAKVYGKNSIGVILSGMGKDGVVVMEKIKKAGGITIAQDEKTSVVFGMNKAAIDSGCIDRILSIDEISRNLVDIAALKQGQNNGLNSV